jgi:uncharacterized protein (DUF433 family)
MPQITIVKVGKDGEEATQRTVDRFEDLLPPTVEVGPKFKGTDVSIKNLFNYLNNGWNLYTFLDYFPNVSAEQALAAIEARAKERAEAAIHSDKRRVSGTPVFKGSRVPIKTLFDYLAAGHSLDSFLYQFPTTQKERAVATLEAAREFMEKIAYEEGLAG